MIFFYLQEKITVEDTQKEVWNKHYCTVVVGLIHRFHNCFLNVFVKILHWMHIVINMLLLYSSRIKKVQCGDSFKLLYDLWNLKNKSKLQPGKDLAGCCWCCINTELYMWKWREGKRKVAQPEMPLTCDLIALNNILPGPQIQESRSSAVAIQNVVISWKKSLKKNVSSTVCSKRKTNKNSMHKCLC